MQQRHPEAAAVIAGLKAQQAKLLRALMVEYINAAGAQPCEQQMLALDAAVREMVPAEQRCVPACRPASCTPPLCLLIAAALQ